MFVFCPSELEIIVKLRREGKEFSYFSIAIKAELCPVWVLGPRSMKKLGKP